MADKESGPRYKINARVRMPRTGGIPDDQIGAMAHQLRQSDPDGEIHLLELRNMFAERGEGGYEFEEFKSEVIKEVTYGKEPYDIEGVNRMRLVVDNYYVRIQIGLIFKDAKDKFRVQREMALNKEEFPLALALLNSVEANQKQQEE